MTARFRHLPWFLVWMACSSPRDILLRHDLPDVWRGEVWSFEDVLRDGRGGDGTVQDARETASGVDIPRSDLGWDASGSDAGPVRFVCDTEVLPALLGLIAEAQERVELMHLEFLEGSLPDQVEEALLHAVGRGVEVRVLLEADVQANANRVASLAAGGAKARLDSSSRSLHVKLAIADRTRVLVGSTNLSTSSLKYNHEANWLFTGSGPWEAFADYGSRLWESDSDLQVLPGAEGEGIRPIGDGQYLEVVDPILREATHRVLVIQYEVDSKDDSAGELIRQVIAARARGADVRVLLERSGFSDALNAANEATRQVLVAGGVEVRLDPPDVVTHAKVVIADDWVVLYSGNWVGTGLRKNHEAGAAVRSAGIADEAAAYFEGLWAAASP